MSITEYNDSFSMLFYSDCNKTQSNYPDENDSFFHDNRRYRRLCCYLRLAAIRQQSTRRPARTGELRVSAPFADQTTQFAFDLAKQVNTAEGQAKNVFISPLSLHIALGMIMNGANGQTAQEIQKTLKPGCADSGRSQCDLPKPDDEPAQSGDPKVTLTLANSVWYRNTFSVENSFQDLLKQTFKADVSAQDFTNPATVNTINNWASQQTNGKIPKVIDQIQPDNVMFLLNALYFKGDWQTRFDATKTIDSPFKLVTDATTTCSHDAAE